MRQTRPNTVLWINTCMNTMCYFPIKCHSAGGGASSHQIHSKHGHSSFTQRQRDIWCHHTEPVSCVVVSLWLCSNTWHFKCPTRATSDNEPPPLFALQSCGLSSSRWQRIYLFPLQSVVWYQFDLCRITFFFVYVHSPSSLSFPVFGSTPGGIFAFAYLQRHQYGTCVIPGDPLCKLPGAQGWKWAMTPSLAFYLSLALADPVCLPVSHSCLCLCLWCRRIIHTHQLRADCRESEARTHLQQKYITVSGTARPD